MVLMLAAMIGPVVADSLIWEPVWDESSEVSMAIIQPAGYIRGSSHGFEPDGIVVYYYEILVFGDGRQRYNILRPIPEGLHGDPFLPETWNARGVELFEAGEFEESIYYFAEAAALSQHFSVVRYPPIGGTMPVDRVYWENLAAAYRAAGKHYEAATVILNGTYHRHHDIYIRDDRV